MSCVSTRPVSIVPPADALQMPVAFERRRSRCASSARCAGSPRSAESDSATCCRPDRADGRRRARAWPSARGTPRPDRLNCRRRPQSRLPPHSWASRKWRRSRRPSLRSAPGSRCDGLRYSAPVAMTTVRAAIDAPSSIGRVRLPVARERGRALGNHDLGAELLRLRERPCPQDPVLRSPVGNPR